MKSICLILVLAVAVPAFGASVPADPKAEIFRQAIATANDAMELHNSVAVSAESILSRAKPGSRQKRDMELLGIVLGSYGIYYKQYCTILQEVDRLEKKASPTAMDEANRAEFWRVLPANRDRLRASSVKIAKLAKQMGIASPAKWDLTR